MVELATFHVGGHWLGLPTADVVEAIDAGAITTATGGAGGALIGYRVHRDVPIPVLDLAQSLGVTAAQGPGGHIVVVRTGGALVGLLADELGDIPEVPAEQIVDIETLKWGQHLPATGIVRRQADDDPQAPLLIILDMARFETLLGLQAAPGLIAAE